MPKQVDLQRAVAEDINVTNPESADGAAATTRAPADLPPPPRPDPPANEGESTPAAITAKSPRRAKASRSIDTSGQAGQIHLSLPASVVAAADADERTRSTIVRVGVNRHGADVVDAFKAAAPSAPGPMLVNRPQRRFASAEDPFLMKGIRLLPAELEALDRLVADANVTRSAFVTAVLELELNLSSAV